MAIYADDAGTLVIWITAGRGGETEGRRGSGERRSTNERKTRTGKNSWALGLSAIRIKMRCVMWAIWCRCEKKEQRRGMQKKGVGCTRYEAWSMVCLMVPQPVHRLALSCNYLYSCCPPARLPAWLHVAPLRERERCHNVACNASRLALKHVHVRQGGKCCSRSRSHSWSCNRSRSHWVCAPKCNVHTRHTSAASSNTRSHTHTHTFSHSPNTGPGNVGRHAQTRPERESWSVPLLGPLALARSDCGSIIRCHYVL